MSNPQVGLADAEAAEAAEAAARTVLRLLAAGDIEIVWLMLHVDYRRGLVNKLLSTSYAAELLGNYRPRLHSALFGNLVRHWLLTTLGPLPTAAASRHACTLELFAADDSVVVTLAIEGEPECRWAIEMTLTNDGWQWRNVVTYRQPLGPVVR